MTYPLSRVVQPGDTTLASQYNDLRSDALTLGNPESSSASLGQMLRDYRSDLALRGSGAEITLDPCGLMIDGVPAFSGIPLTKTVSAIEFSSAGLLQIAVEKSAAGAGMQLFVQTSRTVSAGQRIIGSCYWDPAVPAVSAVRSLAVNPGIPAGIDCAAGRLTLMAGNPIPASDINAADTLYYVPCGGNRISLYREENGWETVQFSALSVPLSGLSASCCYDAWLHLDGSGKPRLTLSPWVDLATRMTPTQWLDGVLVSAESPAYRYLGTIGLSASGISKDTVTDRMVWNLNHPLHRPLRKLCSVTQNTNAVSGAWVPYAQDGSLAVKVVTGLNGAEVELNGLGVVTGMTANSSMLGIGIDINLSEPLMNVNAADLSTPEYKPGALFTRLQNRVANRMLGLHSYHLISYTVNDSHTFGGTAVPQNSVGLSGWVAG